MSGAATKSLAVVMFEKVSPEAAAVKFEDMFLDDEVIELGYKATRDRVIFTDRRMVVINIQGITGKKVEFFTVPYSKISSYSVETTGTFDLESELKIWASGLSGIEIKFLKGIDIREVGRYLTEKLI